MTETFELYAIKYGTHSRPQSQNFLNPPDPHDAPYPIDYYVWVCKSKSHTVVVDTGFDAEAAKARGRTMYRCPVDSLRLIGVDPGDVTDVVITHMHYDHGGNLDKFPKATFHIQDLEMSYVTGRYMRYPVLRNSFDPDDVCHLVRGLYKDRVEFHNGDDALFPGLTLHHVGGHTQGMQFVRAWTERGWVVLASDSMHLYANWRHKNPFPTVLHIGDMLEGHRKVARLAESPDHVVPGHDPLVMELYPPASEDLAGIVARVDLAPHGT
ncbi:MAG: MBL fold hydrolase [Rhodospirillales bacterium CG15_BIG_FIL_POST_REV_8_21_14_020_66_15]|nr:MAG: MBL fold hydrolase [Rhodospirillales bacterium CG15_BIG_FIL_POST_REV_8_21_14_020_66_15]